jgi:hypothetical protein
VPLFDPDKPVGKDGCFAKTTGGDEEDGEDE